MTKIRASIVLSTLFILTCLSALTAFAQDWPMFGEDLTNNANADQTSLTTGNVGRLAPKWIFTTGGDVSARASVVGGVVYFPDWGGNLWALNAQNGSVVWSHQFSDYGLTAGTVSRSAPTIVDGVMYIGTQYNSAATQTGWLLAINAYDGRLIWKTQPDTSNSFPVITAAPSVANGEVFVGMTSDEEFAAANPYYPCCSVRGSVVALDARSGHKLWQTFTVPSGYSGGAVWGSNPVVDTDRQTVYVGTGDNYSHPTDPTFLACIGSGKVESQCLSPNDHVDSILALDMRTGAVKWATKLVTWNQLGVSSGSDDWNVGCAFGGPNCPANLPSTPSGPDFDFGSAPNEITVQGHGNRTIIGAGQKSGIYYALDPDTGSVLWQTQVGPGSSLGGIEWGSASDGKNIYVAISNLYGIPYGGGSAGSFAALDAATGAILWQVADPNGAVDLGPLAVAKGVVYVESMGGVATDPTMFALAASNGSVLWSYAAGSSVISGATISSDSVYWGSGYAHLGIPGYTGNNKFYAFSRNGH